MEKKRTIPPVAILAGGLATRLYPSTKNMPKSMLVLAGKPFISHQLELLKKKGVTEVVICAGYLGTQIQDFVLNGNDFGLEVKYSFDGEKLLGTGGAVKKALSKLRDPFFVMYGDSYLDIDYKEIANYFILNKMPGLMTVLKNENKWDKSNVIFKNNRIVKYEKNDITPDMNYIDYGLGIFRKRVFDNYSKDEIFDLASVYMRLAEKKCLLGYEVENRFYEIGSRIGLEETKKYIVNRNNLKKNM